MNGLEERRKTQEKKKSDSEINPGASRVQR